MIAVTFALPDESSAFLKSLTAAAIDAEAVRVHHTGVGEAACTRSIRQFLAAHSPHLLISSGFAGALTNELQVAELLLAENFTSPEWIDRCHAALGGSERRGVLATAAAITDTAADRTALARRSGAIAVDMETEFIAAACLDAAVPMISLRAISDSPLSPMPAPPRVLFDLEAQKTNYVSLALHVARHPASLPRLIAFGRQIAAAREKLATALMMLVRSAL